MLSSRASSASGSRVLRDGEGLADAGGGDGLPERQLLDEPRQREGRDPDRRGDEEDDIERVREGVHVGVVHGGR